MPGPYEILPKGSGDDVSELLGHLNRDWVNQLVLLQRFDTPGPSESHQKVTSKRHTVPLNESWRDGAFNSCAFDLTVCCTVE